MSDTRIDRERLARALYYRYGRDDAANWKLLPEAKKNRWHQDATDVLHFMEELSHV